MKELLMGNEAIALGAMLAGVNKGLENHKKEVKKSESVED